MVESTGGRHDGGKRVAVICQPDRFANGIKPFEIQRFLRERGHEVTLVDTNRLSRSTRWPRAFGGRLPSGRPGAFALYLNDVAAAVVRRTGIARGRLTYYTARADVRLRRARLRSVLRLDDFDLVICEEPYDAGVLTTPTSARTLYDCPCPWADELYFEGLLTRRQHARLRRTETELFERVDHLAFHWESYARYAAEEYGLSGANLMRLDFGCTPSTRRAAFADPPRIVYMGNLSARFNNPELLVRLAREYPHIDVYGGPPPDPALGLNYRGYTPTPEVLADYQLGLVTCSTDPLRRQGFSSKHTLYLSYGLPVLVPAWRRHLDLLQGSVTYDEHGFRSVVDGLHDELRWRTLSDQAHAQAQRLAWDRTLQPLADLLASLRRDPAVQEEGPPPGSRR
ncbi:hypothetical protein ACI797_16630 [Geodermatophilus sp. SYSU D00691]